MIRSDFKWSKDKEIRSKIKMKIFFSRKSCRMCNETILNDLLVEISFPHKNERDSTSVSSRKPFKRRRTCLEQFLVLYT